MHKARHMPHPGTLGRTVRGCVWLTYSESGSEAWGPDDSKSIVMALRALLWCFDFALLDMQSR